jgi:hypothetical protein
MPAWNSSSLSFSDGMSRHSSGLLKHTNGRVSKQDIHAKRMFGNKKGMHGKDLKIGKMFRKKGKGVGQTKAISSTPHGGISPSVEEFDDMLKGASETGKGKKKGLFRKSFG